MFPVAVASFYGTNRLPSILGVMFTLTMIGTLAGAPLAGLIQEKFGYIAAILYSGIVTIISANFALATKFAKNRRVWKKV